MPRIRFDWHFTWTRLALWGVLVYGLVYAFTMRLEGDKWQTVIDSDGIGYYSYLPAAFIYHDATYGFIDTLADRHRNLGIAREAGFANRFEGKRVNKYFLGEAVAIAPFFLAAHLFSGSAENPADGYSFYYACAVSLAALFYLLLGLWSIAKLLERFGVSDGLRAIVLLGIFFGTNLHRYATWEQTMTHVYSFGFTSLFLLLMHWQFETFNARKLAWAALVLGMIVIIRPVNLLIVLALPFLAGDWETLKRFFTEAFRKPVWLGVSALAFLAVVFLQLLYYKIASGHWYVYAYSKEGFDFAHPNFFKCLFSYSNGFYVYAPLLFVATFGVFTLVRRERFRFAAFFLFFIPVVWVISSWWAWTYGGAFGMRPLVEYIPLFAILLGLLLKKLVEKRFLVPLFTGLLLLPLVVFTQFQLWQYRWGIIGVDDMTAEKYWHVFLETRDQFLFSGNYMPPPPLPPGSKLVYTHTIDFETPDTSIDWRSVGSEKVFAGKYSVCLRDGKNHPPRWKRRLRDLLPDSLITNRVLWLKVRSKWLLEDNGSDARMVVNTQRGTTLTHYEEHYIIHQVRTENKWSDMFVRGYMGYCEPDDFVEVYPRRDNWFPVYVDDVVIEIWVEK